MPRGIERCKLGTVVSLGAALPTRRWVVSIGDYPVMILPGWVKTEDAALIRAALAQAASGYLSTEDGATCAVYYGEPESVSLQRLLVRQPRAAGWWKRAKKMLAPFSGASQEGGGPRLGR